MPAVFALPARSSRLPRAPGPCCASVPPAPPGGVCPAPSVPWLTCCSGTHGRFRQGESWSSDQRGERPRPAKPPPPPRWAVSSSEPTGCNQWGLGAPGRARRARCPNTSIGRPVTCRLRQHPSSTETSSGAPRSSCLSLTEVMLADRAPPSSRLGPLPEPAGLREAARRPPRPHALGHPRAPRQPPARSTAGPAGPTEPGSQHPSCSPRAHLPLQEAPALHPQTHPPGLPLPRKGAHGRLGSEAHLCLQPLPRPRPKALLGPRMLTAHLLRSKGLQSCSLLTDPPPGLFSPTRWLLGSPTQMAAPAPCSELEPHTGAGGLQPQPQVHSALVRATAEAAGQLCRPAPLPGERQGADPGPGQGPRSEAGGRGGRPPGRQRRGAACEAETRAGSATGGRAGVPTNSSET